MTFSRIANSIATRIILIGVLLLTAGNVARYFALSKYLRDGMSEVVAAQQMTLAGFVARKIDHEIVERRETLQHLSETLPLDLLEKPKALDSWLALRHQSQRLFTHSLLVCNPAGEVLAGSSIAGDLLSSACSDADLLRAAGNGTFAIGRPQGIDAAKLAVLPLALPIKDESGHVRAALVGVTVLNSTDFISFSGKDKIGKTGSFLLVSPRDKLFIAATDPGQVLKATPPPNVDKFHDRAMQGIWDSGITVNAKGVEEIVAVAPVSSTGWFVAASLPTAEAFTVVERTQKFMARNSALTLMGFLALTSVLMYFVFRPLLQSARQADRMTKGEVPLAPLTVVRNDEVGRLTDAFNGLLEKLRSSQSEMAHMAHHDVLTGLPNRALLADRLNQAVARANRNGSRLAFLCIDLDNFKPINDELGHAVGDMALAEVTRRWKDIVRESDTLARIGGDEFALLLADLDGDRVVAEQIATAVATKCLAALAPPLILKSQGRTLGASIGIAMGDGLVSPHALQLAADSAMYQAKNAGGQRYMVATRSS